MEDQDFIVNAGPQGTFRKSGTYHTTPEQVDAIFDKIAALKPKQITLYFHGGLVNETAGVGTARKLQPQLCSKDHYPVFLVWETGLVEILAANIRKISETGVYQKLLKMLIKVLEKKLGVEVNGARGELGMLSDIEVELQLMRERPFEHADVGTVAAARSAAPIRNLPEDDSVLMMDYYPEFEDLLLKDSDIGVLMEHTDLYAEGKSPQVLGGRGPVSMATLAFNLTKIAIRVAKRFFAKRDHGFFPTIVEEIMREFYIAELGAWAWNEMKLKAGYVWKDNKGLQGLDQHAGRYFLDKLVDYLQRSSDAAGKHTVQVNLIGHSAGSIAICELLSVSAGVFPQLKFNQLIFMAPACRTDLFMSTVLTHPERYNSLRCFTMSDENECKDMLVPYFYTRSLLYFISGVLEQKGKGFDEQILGMERYLLDRKPYSDDPELIDLKAYFNLAGLNRLVLSKTVTGAELGLRTASLSHGGFDGDELTVESVRSILKI